MIDSCGGVYYLFVDTSSHLTLGLLGPQFKWIDYHREKQTKNAGIFHSILFNLLKKNSLTILDIKKVFRISGPGSYTGLRLAEGLIEVFKWQNKTTFSFNHFHIPQLLGEDSGIWLSKAFKKEIFIYSWKGQKRETQLIAESHLPSILDQYHKDSGPSGKIYTHFSGPIEGNFLETSKLIKAHETQLFSAVSEQKLNADTFYYRAVEKEFRPLFWHSS